jgi:hypothetical protein
MSFIAKLLTRLRAKPVPVAPTTNYLESEFTRAMLDVARKRTSAEQTAREAAKVKPA